MVSIWERITTTHNATKSEKDTNIDGLSSTETRRRMLPLT